MRIGGPDEEGDQERASSSGLLGLSFSGLYRERQPQTESLNNGCTQGCGNLCQSTCLGTIWYESLVA